MSSVSFTSSLWSTKLFSQSVVLIITWTRQSGKVRGEAPRTLVIAGWSGLSHISETAISVRLWWNSDRQERNQSPLRRYMDQHTRMEYSQLGTWDSVGTSSVTTWGITRTTSANGLKMLVILSPGARSRSQDLESSSSYFVPFVTRFVDSHLNYTLLKILCRKVTRFWLDSFILQVYTLLFSSFIIFYAWSNFVVRWREKEAWVFIGVGGSLLWRVVLLLQRIEIKWKGDDWNWSRGTSLTFSPLTSGFKWI
jgi:hypothetical protein